MSLRTRVLRGGVYLVLRQGLGIAVSVVGIILLTRFIGSEAYGLYAAAFGIYQFLLRLGSWGVNIYLIRLEGDPQPQDYHQAFSLLLLLGLVGAGAATLLLPLLARWVRLEGFSPVAATLFAGLPVALLTLVPVARLERVLNYRPLAAIELLGHTSTYVVALPLAYQGLGPWAPVAGLWSQQLLTLGLFYWVSGYRPRPYWERTRVRAMLGYGLGYSASALAWELRYLVNPLVVSRYAGAEAVGYVALTIRLTEHLSFVTGVISRLATATLARLQENRDRMVKAVSEGLSLQIIVLGPILAGFGLAAPWVVPLLLGPNWLPVSQLYPFIALSYLCQAGINLYSSTLSVLQRNWVVAAFDLGHVVILAGAASLLVPHLGFRGYGWAEIVALPSFVLFAIWFQVYIGKAKYTRAGIWFTAWALPLFSWQLGLWVWASVIVPLVWPATRRELLQALTAVLRRTY